MNGESDQHILSSRSRPSRVPQVTCTWMSLPGVRGLGNQPNYRVLVRWWRVERNIAILQYFNAGVTAPRSMKTDSELWWGDEKHSDWDELAWELSDFPLGPDHIAR